ncbi:EF-hand calcium-binding domain-containing protein 11-like [Saccoglossus kowalevskii]|uniref:EF-hand calcium-binding domain-containing protein 11-like n=1 Tax=Saccoglossus kowalevskii TaxID=10224 RepID=A0ABM0GX38_SACKO|nr:PREDICTED: EF-hand calcium-binding domain-containing protein 11-like [Saccoglossus kowalevskii]
MTTTLFKFGGYQLPARQNITEEDKKTIATVFHECDQGQKGYLSHEDVKVAFVSLLGYKPTKYEVEELMKQTEIIDGTPRMAFEHFIQVMSSKMSVVDRDDEIRQTFMVFDMQCKGFLTIDDLKKAFSHVAPHIAAHRVEAAFREVDRDADGRVSYKDFEFMMKYHLEDL